MPELPEVETIARTLAPSVVGRSIVRVEIRNKGSWQGSLLPSFICAHGPRRIAGTGRRGKLLLIYFNTERGQTPCTPKSLTLAAGMQTETWLDDIRALGIHLKMTGRVFVHPAGIAPTPHTRIIFHLDDDTQLFFDDARKFGLVRALNPTVLESWSFWQTLGPEPFDLNDAEFAHLFRHRSAAIKALLLQQNIIAGVGNIYADESLFRAGIRPDCPAKAISPDRLHVLRQVLVEVLEESIAACGSSIRDYRTANGDAGAFQNSFRVYGRAEQACTQCGAILHKMSVAGRTTVYCPHCQNH